MSLLAPPARAAAGAGAASAQARALLRISVCTASSSPHRHGSDQPAPLPAKSRWRPDLTENIYTAANGLTVSRILMTPVIGYLIVQQSFVSACSLLAIAALTDLLDGYLARNFDQKTVLGSVLDPAADKILMTTLTVSLCQAGLLPLALAVLIIGRDVGLVLGTAYYRYISLQPPRTLQRYFDPSMPTAEVHPPLISKLNTLLQLALMGASLAMPVIGLASHPLLMALQYTVGITTIWSGLHYVFSPDVIKIIKR